MAFRHVLLYLVLDGLCLFTEGNFQFLKQRPIRNHFVTVLIIKVNIWPNVYIICSHFQYTKYTLTHLGLFWHKQSVLFLFINHFPQSHFYLNYKWFDFSSQNSLHYYYIPSWTKRYQICSYNCYIPYNFYTLGQRVIKSVLIAFLLLDKELPNLFL